MRVILFVFIMNKCNMVCFNPFTPPLARRRCSNNNIGDSGATALAPALSRLTALKYLYLKCVPLPTSPPLSVHTSSATFSSSPSVGYLAHLNLPSCLPPSTFLPSFPPLQSLPSLLPIHSHLLLLRFFPSKIIFLLFLPLLLCLATLCRLTQQISIEYKYKSKAFPANQNNHAV